MYSFRVTSITNYHKLGGLIQRKCILSEFWRSEIQNQGVSRAHLPLKTKGGGCFLLSFPAQGDLSCSLACGCQTPGSTPSFI